MRASSNDEALLDKFLLGDALQVVRLLKGRSRTDRLGDQIAWEQVEAVLLAEESDAESSTPLGLQHESERDSCCCSHSESVSGNSPVRFDDDRLQKALLFIHQHIDESIGVQSIARDICVSRRWLEYAFRAAFGITPFQYLRTVRLELARLRLMSDPQSKVNQIAVNSGYASARQFTMTFRQYFGYSPSVCRKQQGAEFSEVFGRLAEAC